MNRAGSGLYPMQLGLQIPRLTWKRATDAHSYEALTRLQHGRDILTA
jgi:hypothetical protein